MRHELLILLDIVGNSGQCGKQSYQVMLHITA